jgi:hypothetical protein
MTKHLEGLASATTQRDPVTALRTVTGLIQLLLALLLITAASSVTHASSDRIAGSDLGHSLQYVLVVEPGSDHRDHGLGLLSGPRGLGDDDGPGAVLIDRADTLAIAPLLTGGMRRVVHAPPPAQHNPCAAPPTGPPSA